MIERSLTGSLRGRPISLVSPEDFVLLEVLSTRDRDIEDAASVLSNLRGRLDLALIEREAIPLASEIPDHPIADRIALARRSA